MQRWLHPAHVRQSQSLQSLLSRMVADKLRLVWGVYAVVVPHMDSTEELIHAAEEAFKKAGFVQTGDEVVILGGTAPIRGLRIS